MKKVVSIVMLLMVMVGCWAQLPSCKLRDVNGKVVDTAKLSNDGKPIIISFFATWCKPCMREIKAINEVIADWEDETGVQVILVSIDDAQNSSKVKPLVDGFGWDFKVLLDPNGDFKRAMNVQAIPHVFVIDGKGKIVHNHSGYTDGAENALYEVVKKAAKK